MCAVATANGARRPVSRVLSAPFLARDDHSSGTRLAARLTRPTRTARRECLCTLAGTAVPIRSCSRWGLPCRPCCQGRGALLPHRFTLARGLSGKPWQVNPGCAGGLFSVALSLGSPPPAVGRHRIPVEPGLSSARRANPACSGRPAIWRGETCAPGWTRVKHRSWQSPAFAIRGMLAIRPADPCGRAGGRIAQLVEQLTLNQRAVGSSPTAPTTKPRKYLQISDSAVSTIGRSVGSSGTTSNQGSGYSEARRSHW